MASESCSSGSRRHTSRASYLRTPASFSRASSSTASRVRLAATWRRHRASAQLATLAFLLRSKEVCSLRSERLLQAYFCCRAQLVVCLVVRGCTQTQ